MVDRDALLRPSIVKRASRPCLNSKDENAEYVLLRADLYDRLKIILSGDQAWGQDAYAASMEAFARDGWDDPRRDVYDSLPPAEEP